MSDITINGGESETLASKVKKMEIENYHLRAAFEAMGELLAEWRTISDSKFVEEYEGQKEKRMWVLMVNLGLIMATAEKMPIRAVKL